MVTINKVDSILNRMRENKNIYKLKGDYGEKAVIEVVKEYKSYNKCFFVHSFSYPYASNRQGIPYAGNIKLVGENLEVVESNRTLNDEIDIILVTEFKIFCIEAKARGGKWNFYNYWATQNNTPVDKCPTCQCEKHARHLYHYLYPLLPEGDARYIVPLTVFVDKCTIKEERDVEIRNYYPLAILNNLEEIISIYDKPFQNYKLDIDKIYSSLRTIGDGTYYR